MSDFGTDIFQKLADAFETRPLTSEELENWQRENGHTVGEEGPKNAPVMMPDGTLSPFTHEDHEILQKFKDAAFRLLMLRAKNFLEATQQERPGITEDTRIAVAELAFRFNTDHLHPNKKGRFELAGNLGPITQILESHFDGGERNPARELCDEFKQGVYLLTCA